MKQKALGIFFASSLMLTLIVLRAPAQTQGSGQHAAQQRPEAVSYHALVIGNNAYSFLPRLKTAEADARQVAALLKDNYGFETRLLLNGTREQIMSALNSYRRTLGAEANLLIYYAGHGVNDKEADKAYWLPVDAARDVTSNWIIADEITTAIKVVPARHVLVVSDSCYSGTLTRGLGELLAPASAREQYLQRMMAGRSRRLMASGGNEPVADSGGGDHSVFAAALLRGLREMDKPRFTGAELFRSYVEEAVAGRANQLPEYSALRNSGHDSGDFVFVRVKGSEKAAEVKTPKTSPPDGAEPYDTARANAEELVARSDKAFDSGRYDEVIRLTTEAIRIFPYNAPAYSNRAAAHSRRGEYDAALRDATEAIRLDPQNAISYSNRASVYISKGEYDAAIRDATEAIRLDPQNAIAHGNRAAAYLEKGGEHDAVIRDATEAIRLNPRDVIFYGSRAAGHFGKAEYDTAIRYATEAIRLNPKYANGYMYRAAGHFSKGQYDAAIRDATEAIKLYPQSANSYDIRGAAYQKKGQYDAAIRDATEAIRLDPRHTTAYGNRSLAHIKKGNYEAAIRDATEAIRLDPQNARGHSNRASAYVEKGEYDAALRDATEAIRLDPQDPHTYEIRATAYEKLGVKDRAMADRQKAKELISKR